MSSRLCYFNPGHETAVRAGNAHYTPPAPVRKMAADLALLPLWYAEAGDYVLTGDAAAAAAFMASLPTALCPSVTPFPNDGRCTTELEASPWGLSPQSIYLFETLRKRCPALVVPRWKDTYLRLTGRRTAAECLRRLRTLLPELPFPQAPLFCSSIDEVRQFMATCPPPCILKTPYSCSGRGVYVLSNSTLDRQAVRWIGGALKKQHEVSIEPMLDRVCDFALEFESDGNGQIRCGGLSVFDTLPRGLFCGCRLGSRETLRGRLRPYLPDTLLQNVQEAVATVLAEMVATVYRGYMGMDMLVYRRGSAFAVHPAIELNLRNTMGWVAVRLSDRWIHPRSQGRMTVACDAREGAALASHTAMQKAYPLCTEGGKITAGYLSLCPVAPDTHYRAYILVEEGRQAREGVSACESELCRS